MNIFLLKLILAPIIIGGASLAGRKWGPAVSGWIVCLPLTELQAQPACFEVIANTAPGDPAH